MSVRKRTWEILEAGQPNDLPSRTFDYFMLTMIMANVIAVIAGSVKTIQAQFGASLDAFEIISVGIFSAEYVARLWSCREDPRYAAPLTGKLKYAIHPMSIIDLAAIAPFYLPMFGVDLRSLRVLRLLRILRVAKVGRYYSSFAMIKTVIKSKKEELILTSAFLLMLLVVASSVLYYCENTAQPEAFSSIPATMWWAVATLTTVGYGDIYPVTALGKTFASIIAILGIGMFALPTGILGAGFVEEIERAKSRESYCPHCGERLH